MCYKNRVVLRLASSLALVTMLTACGGGKEGGDTDSGAAVADSGPVVEPRVELGTGRTSFVEIPESGATLELIAGPQGGWHIDVTARLWGLEIDGLILTYEIRRDGEMINLPRQFTLREALVVREGDHWLRAGDFVPFDIGMPSEVVGDTVTVHVIAEHVDGPRAEDSRTVTIVDEE